MFEIGDRVTLGLKPDDPVMTVTGFSPRGRVWVEWERKGSTYDTLADAMAFKNGVPTIEEASFPPECLRRIELSELEPARA